MKKKTLWIVLAVVLGAGIAAALFFLLYHPQQTLYYNLYGAVYQNPANTALSIREPDDEGIYWLEFAVDGKTETYYTTDKDLVNYADFLPVSILKVSANGELQDVRAPGKPVSKKDTIQQVFDDHLVLNSSFAYNGKQTTLPLAEGCRFYDLSTGGDDTQPQIMDEILAYANARGEATDVFILRRTPATKLYWRWVRCYDNKTGTSTRTPDAQGEYSLTFACEGESMKLKCKDPAIVTAIDTPQEQDAAMGLVFDEDGYITQVLPGYRAIHGRELCNTFDITAMDGDQFTVVNKQYSDYGRTYHLTLDPDCKIYDVSDGAASWGQTADSLQVGDRVTVFSDPMGIATHVFINIRLTGSKLYYNLVRAYGGNHAVRKDADGWYTFNMLCDGQQLTLKTQDDAVASKVNGFYGGGMGLELDGDVILRAYSASCVTGSESYVSERYVYTVNEAMLIHCRQNMGSPKPLMLHPDVQICDISDLTKIIPNAKLGVGDRFSAFSNADGQATHIFITRKAQ